MSSPIHIRYRQNVDHFVEASAQMPPAPGRIPDKVQNIFIGLIIGGTLIYFCVTDYRKRGDLGLTLLACLGVLLIMAFWWWFFKRIGLTRRLATHEHRWTDKERARLQRTLQKKIGQEDLLVSCDFDDSGFRLAPENSNATRYPWSVVQRVVERPQGVFVFMNSWTYFWFPKVAFTSLDDFRALLEIVSTQVAKVERLNLVGMAFVALGSNLGNSTDILRGAIQRLEKFSARPLLKSSFWRTTPVDCPPDSPMFVNAVVALKPCPGETPESLLTKLHALEKDFGRQPKTALNEPRALDLDLIAFGSEIRSTPQLTLPHPRAHARRFVLEPLNEIAPDLLLPGQSNAIRQLLANLRTEEVVRRL
jgi:2-amino-4-hydroxy-6-hydroxymethyldihydropteridine diphosphokinase